MHIDSRNDVTDPETLLGARKSFYALYANYEHQLVSYDGSLEQLIAAKLPLLGRGLAGSALHGIIQLGYGYSARNETSVCCVSCICLWQYVAINDRIGSTPVA